MLPRYHPYATATGRCSSWPWRLQPYVIEAATLCDRGCNPVCWRLQPYVIQVQQLAVEGVFIYGAGAKPITDFIEEKVRYLVITPPDSIGGKLAPTHPSLNPSPYPSPNPNPNQVALSGNGGVIVDGACATSVQGVYAIGDICDKPHRQQPCCLSITPPAL